MIVLMKSAIELTEPERMELSQRATSRSGRADDGRRARLILLLEAGHSWAQIRDKLDYNDAFIDRWSKRFGRERLAGLFSRHAGRGPSKLTPALEARHGTLRRSSSPSWQTSSSTNRRPGDPRDRRQPVGVQDQANHRVLGLAPQRPLALYADLLGPGSTRSSCGSPRSSVTSSHAASSPRFPTCAESSCATSATTTRLIKP